MDVIITSKFRYDLKRLIKRNKSINKLEHIVDLLQKEDLLPQKSKDHYLTGNWTGHRECHIEPDWLLIYKIEKENLLLVRTGTHSDLF